MSVRLQILGPVRMLVDGAPISVGPPRQAAVLVALALDANRVVGVDRIVDVVWGEDPPNSAAHMVRTYVSQLRKLLSAEGPAIDTAGSGYVLRMSPDAIDASRFEALLSDARDIGDDHPAQAVALVKEGLELWKGPPLGGAVASAGFEAEARRLEELRLVAIEEQLAARSALGEDRELVPELEALLIEHPYRERLWGQLMVALFRSGRQPDALRAYQRACELFAELGTAPSAELKDLEEQILLRDPGLERAPVAVMAGNLPAPRSSFIGRELELDAVRGLVEANRLVTLIGAGGVGKTRLAVEATRGLQARFSDGVWLVEFAGVDVGDLVPSQLAGTIGVSNTSGEELQGSLIAGLQSRNALLLLDGCEHLIGAVRDLVAGLLAGCPQLHILVTSRQRLGAEGEVTWRTEPLAVDASTGAESAPGAVALFLDRARAAQPAIDITPETKTLAEEACRRLAGVPLAIELAASRLHMMSLRRLVDRLEDEFELLANSAAPTTDHHHAMRATLDWSYRLLDPGEQDLFRRLAVFRGGFTLESVEAFNQASPDADATLRLMGGLVDASMVTPTPHDRFTMLEPIRQYGLVLLNENSETAAASRQHAIVYRDMLRVPDTAVFAMLSDPEQFTTEVDNVRAALGWALESGTSDIASELGAVAGGAFFQTGLLREAKRWLDQVLAADSRPSLHRARALFRACYIAAVIEGLDEAEQRIEELGATAEALDDEQWRAACVERRGLLAWFRDDLPTASALIDEAAERWLRLGLPDAAAPLSNLMEMLFWAGHYEKAETIAARIVDISRQLDTPYAAARALRDQAYIAVNRGDPAAAEDYLAAADDRLPDPGLFRYTGALDPTDGAIVIRGYIALIRGDLDEAEELSTAAIIESQRTREPDSLYGGLILDGLVRLNRDDVYGAHRVLSEALRESSRVQLDNWRRYVLGPFAATAAIIEPHKGAVLLGAIEAINRRDDRSFSQPIADAVAQANSHLDQALPAEAREHARQAGEAMSLDQAIALALEAD